MPDKEEPLLPAAGESDLPGHSPLTKEEEKEVSRTLETGVIDQLNISKELSGKPPATPIVHGQERIVLAGIAMIISLVAAFSPYTPDNARSGALSIATLVATALTKPFERN